MEQNLNKKFRTPFGESAIIQKYKELSTERKKILFVSSIELVDNSDGETTKAEILVDGDSSTYLHRKGFYLVQCENVEEPFWLEKSKCLI